MQACQDTQVSKAAKEESSRYQGFILALLELTFQWWEEDSHMSNQLNQPSHIRVEICQRRTKQVRQIHGCDFSEGGQGGPHKVTSQ